MRNLWRTNQAGIPVLASNVNYILQRKVCVLAAMVVCEEQDMRVNAHDSKSRFLPLWLCIMLGLHNRHH